MGRPRSRWLKFRERFVKAESEEMTTNNREEWASVVHETKICEGLHMKDDTFVCKVTAADWTVGVR